jgi:hypothetical protein
MPCDCDPSPWQGIPGLVCINTTDQPIPDELILDADSPRFFLVCTEFADQVTIYLPPRPDGLNDEQDQWIIVAGFVEGGSTIILVKDMDDQFFEVEIPPGEAYTFILTSTDPGEFEPPDARTSWYYGPYKNEAT